MASSASRQRLTLSYLLWLGGFFGFSGLHRLYNGKITSGLIWFFTLGLFGFGQFIDVFLVPGMTEDHELRRLRSHYGDNIYDLLNQPLTTAQPHRPLTREEKMVKLTRAAKQSGGYLSVTAAVLETGLGFEEVETLLKEMARSGYVGVDNHPESGAVIYRFEEMTV
ncbi:MAG: TM2 domain-containing protein [Leptolyngbyaceae cyanobacterium]